MSQTYVETMEQYCPKAVLGLGRFDIVKGLNRVVFQVRKEQWAKGSISEEKTLKGVRSVMFKDFANRKKILESSMPSKGKGWIHRTGVLNTA